MKITKNNILSMLATGRVTLPGTVMKSLEIAIVATAILGTSSVNATAFNAEQLFGYSNSQGLDFYDSAGDFSNDGSAVTGTLADNAIIGGVDVNYRVESSISAGAVVKLGASITTGQQTQQPNSSFFAVANTLYSDTFTISGGENISTFDIIFNIDGSLKSGFGGSASIEVENEFTLEQYFFRNINGLDNSVIDTQFTIPAIEVLDGVALVNFSLYANVSTSILATTSSYDGFSNFLNTITISSFQGFDASGGSVELASIVDSSGFEFVQVSTVPEPSTLFMFAPALLGLIGFRSKLVKSEA